MQLVVHAPFGSRVNKAWGLALRKKFCLNFSFELQAAATEEGIVLSLGPQQSFPLEEVFEYLRPQMLRDTLVQALLDAPLFQTRWRWNATLSLAVRRSSGGARVPPQLQRMQAGDFLTAVGALRREVERSSVSGLPRLAREAMGLTDLICWAALAQGDVYVFRECARAAAALREFADSAGLTYE